MRVFLAFGVGVVIMLLLGCEPGVQEEPESVEQFRVAEPLGADTEGALRAQIETITAVTEPYDEVEAKVEPEAALPLASNRAELEQQCVTALKEVAFCTNEDRFLDLIGTVEGLQLPEERERFLSRVQQWFEPGGVRRDCGTLLSGEESMEERSRKMWKDAAGASERLCPEFGSALLEADAFRWLAGLWAEEVMEAIDGSL